MLFSNYYTAATAKDVAGDSDNDEDGYLRLLETEDEDNAASDGSSDNDDGYLEPYGQNMLKEEVSISEPFS